MNGRLRRNTSPMTVQGSPLPTSAPNRLAIWFSSMMLVRAATAKTNGAASCRRTYRLSRRTGPLGG